MFAAFANAFCFYASGEGLEECMQISDAPCSSSVFMAYVVLPAISSVPFILRLLQANDDGVSWARY